MDSVEFKEKLSQIPQIDVPKVAQQFATYADELIATNREFNLTSITDESGIYLKHFYDSIMPIFHLNGTTFNGELKICDVGTGGGFPGIPLKIIYPDLKLTLLDSSQKKLKFLENLCEKLHLDNVEFIWQRAEEYGRGPGRAKFDLVVSRAVANLQVLSEYCLPLVKKDGFFISYKGKNGRSEIAPAEELITKLGGKLDLIEEVNLDNTDNYRTLIMIKKIKETPQKYPRSNGKIKAALRGNHGK